MKKLKSIIQSNLTYYKLISSSYLITLLILDKMIKEAEAAAKKAERERKKKEKEERERKEREEKELERKRNGGVKEKRELFIQ